MAANEEHSLNEGQTQLTYDDIKDEANKPYSERQEQPVGRGGRLVKPRRYHRDGDEAKRKRREAEERGEFWNPLDGRKGCQYFQVQALAELGCNEWHPFDRVRDMICQLMSQDFTDNPGAKNGEKTPYYGAEKKIDRWTKWNCDVNFAAATKPNTTDLNARIVQNFKVLQRTYKPNGRDKNPYGLKLQQALMCVDIAWVADPRAGDASVGTWWFRLNTCHEAEEEVEPLFETRKPPQTEGEQSEGAGTPTIGEQSAEAVETDVVGSEDDEDPYVVIDGEVYYRSEMTEQQWVEAVEQSDASASRPPDAELAEHEYGDE